MPLSNLPVEQTPSPVTKTTKPLTAEGAVAAAPEFILVTSRGLKASGGCGWPAEAAGSRTHSGGKEKRVIAMDDLLLLGFGPRVGQAAKEALREAARRSEVGSTVTKTDRRRAIVMAGLVLGLAVTVVASLCIGAVKIPLPDVLASLFGTAEDSRYQRCSGNCACRALRWDFSWAALSPSAGVLMQEFSAIRWPTRRSSGRRAAARWARFCDRSRASFLSRHPLLSVLRLLPLAAFAGALLVTGLVQRLSNVGGYTAVATLLLVGVAINASGEFGDWPGDLSFDRCATAHPFVLDAWQPWRVRIGKSWRIRPLSASP